MENKKVLFSVKNLKKYFPVKKKKLFQREQYYVHANEDISLDIYEGETVGLVGESGCGKSTFGRTMLQIYSQTAGSTLYYGKTLAEVAPDYVIKSLDAAPNKFSEFKSSLAELEKMEEELNKKEGLEFAELNEKIIEKRKFIDNNYINFARILGGLLVHNNLAEVVSTAKARHLNLIEIAKLNRQLANIESGVQSGDTATLKKQISDKENITKEYDKKLEDFRNEIKDNPDYEKFQSFYDEGVDLSMLSYEEMRHLRKDLQFIFQDPYSSLNTHLTVGQIIGEGLIAHNMFKDTKSEEYNEYIQKIMGECGLAPYFIHRYPHQFSGGQRQRIGIARALALQPKFIVCDEAVSALDVSIQSQILNLLQDLREKNNLTYLFITHDLSVVRYISDRIGVMYLGMLVELAESEMIFDDYLHPYTKALLEAIPRTDVEKGELSILGGDVPSAVFPPDGCRFHTRCAYAMEECEKFKPDFKEYKPGHFCACHLLEKQLREGTNLGPNNAVKTKEEVF